MTSPSSRPTRILSKARGVFLRDLRRGLDAVDASRESGGAVAAAASTRCRRRDRRARRYFAYQKKRAVELPPPTKPNRISIECYGLTMARGGGWIGPCLCGSNTLRRVPRHRRGACSMAWRAGFSIEAPDTLVDFHTGYCDASGKQTVHELTPNMTGFHVLELDVHATKGITLCNSFVDRKRFDIYGKTDLEVDRFSAFVKKLPAGRVVAIAITDTAVAAKRPPSDKLYDALRLLGAPSQMEKIGYRFPFAFLGVKGGTGHLLMDKTKFLLRIDAALAASGVISDVTTEKTDVTAKVILASAGKK